MSRSTKAALMSAFLFPGAGHFYLKQYFTGTVLIGAALGSLSYLSIKIIDRALLIAEEIQAGKVQLNVTEITELVSKQSAGSEAYLSNIATAVLLISWLIGIIDSYRAGLKQKIIPE